MELTNFRDLGGLIGFEGKKIKEKAILRAAQPVGLVESDVEKLIDGYRLAHIIDFRSEDEVASEPVDIVHDVDYLNIDILASYMRKQRNAPSIEEMLKNLQPGEADLQMSEIYVDLVTSEDSLVGYRKFIDALLNPKGALLFHCYAGKDRTGWGAVIILKILGVSDEDIYIDYLATVEARQTENAKVIDEYRKKGITEVQLIALEEFMSVKRLYLDVAFNSVEREYGTFDNYLQQGLNVTVEEIKKLRSLYLA